MRFCIHRGSAQIGGSCVELEAGGKRLLLDLGLPLDASMPSSDLVPKISGLREPDPTLLGIVISHCHRDHWGLLPYVATKLPLFMGAATERIMQTASRFISEGFAPEALAYLSDRVQFSIGPFQVTPYLVDHAGFVASALVVEARGKRLLYSGDFRAHGRKGALVERVLRHPPVDIDVLLMEGSSLGRLDFDQEFPTEGDLEEQFVSSFRDTTGMALVACSAQNIDRVVTVYRAAKRTGRQLIVDAYAAEILKATDQPSIPKPADDWSDVKVFIPQRQRVMLKRSGIASIVDSYRGRRIWPQDMAAVAPRSVFLVRRWMLRELGELGALAGASAIWSQWHGYLADGEGKAFCDEIAELDLPFQEIHTSGHASPKDLQRFAAAVKPRKLTAIHTFQPEVFPRLFENVVLSKDGEWQTV
ncbi:MAG: MBL fold metallo-hydrolase [Brucella intermedia]